MNRRPTLARLLIGAIVATGVGLVSGCGAVRPQPFQEFAQAATELRGNVGRALDAGPRASEERFVEEALSERTAVLQLQLASADDPLSWDTAEAPLFLTAEMFRAGVRRVTSVLADYANLLLELASPELLQTDQFDALAENLTANSITAVNAISGNQPPVQPFAIVSAAASELFRGYLESKRQGELVDALRANQETMQEFSSLLVSATEIAGEATWQEYLALVEVELDSISTPGASDAAVRASIEHLIALDRTHIAQLEALSALRETFAAIPSSHAGLIRSVEDPNVGLTTINAALERSQALAALVDRIESEN